MLCERKTPKCRQHTRSNTEGDTTFKIAKVRRLSFYWTLAAVASVWDQSKTTQTLSRGRRSTINDKIRNPCDRASSLSEAASQRLEKMRSQSMSCIGHKDGEEAQEADPKRSFNLFLNIQHGGSKYEHTSAERYNSPAVIRNSGRSAHCGFCFTQRGTFRDRDHQLGVGIMNRKSLLS